MQTNREWIGIADMMSGLMMVFLFIAIVFMIEVEKDKDAMALIAKQVETSRNDLYLELTEEFKNDLPIWGAEILKDNTIRFKEPDILFTKNSSAINNKFASILNDFFPRYLAILTKDKYRNDIVELRIEGHTSSAWRNDAPKEVAYLANARLSQDRSFAVLQYAYRLPSVTAERDWLANVIRANGLSFAKRIMENGKENRVASRRVEFRVITNTEERIYDIIEKSKD